jgi:hypothetical protein
MFYKLIFLNKTTIPAQQHQVIGSGIAEIINLNTIVSLSPLVPLSKQPTGPDHEIPFGILTMVNNDKYDLSKDAYEALAKKLGDMSGLTFLKVPSGKRLSANLPDRP